VAYGATAGVLSQSARAWEEIVRGLQPDEKPERKPFIVAAYQSCEEAMAALATSLDTPGRVAGPPPDATPGDRLVDKVAAFVVSRMLEEPVLDNDEETFVAATELVAKPEFQRARRALFDLEDDLYVDDWPAKEVEEKLTALEEEYNAVVRQFVRSRRKRRVATLLPKAAGWGALALGHPHAKGPVEQSLKVVVGAFASLDSPMDPQDHPGAAFAMIRAAYRERRAEPVDRATIATQRP
jgi:hypothetical protein